MNPTLLLLLAPMLVLPFIAKFILHRTITWWEVLGQVVIGALVIVMVWSLSTYSMTADTETLNGAVTSKERNEVSCSHSYPCNCRQICSGSGNSRSCSTHCDTCYHHSYDVDWDVHSTLGTFSINRADWQGLDEPERWTIVKPGDPVALPHGYTNYVKGAPDSLFHVIGDFKGSLPEYPGYYDYQYSDRVIGAPRDGERWNLNLAKSLNQLGAEKQVNFVLVITKEGRRFADALKSKWIGGKKNDIVIVVGSRTYPAIDWVEVFSWSKQDIVNISIREDILTSQTLDPDRTIKIIHDNAQRLYVRRPMSDFDYLAYEIQPSAWIMILALILGSAASGAALVFFHHNGVDP